MSYTWYLYSQAIVIEIAQWKNSRCRAIGKIKTSSLSLFYTKIIKGEHFQEMRVLFNVWRFHDSTDGILSEFVKNCNHPSFYRVFSPSFILLSFFQCKLFFQHPRRDLDGHGQISLDLDGFRQTQRDQDWWTRTLSWTLFSLSYFMAAISGNVFRLFC